MKKMIDGALVDLTPDEQEEYDARQAAHAEELPIRLIAALAAHRYNVETGGISVGGMTVLTDDRSKLMIAGALSAAQRNQGFVTKWKTPDGFVTLTAGQIVAVGDAVANHVQKCFAAEAQVLESTEDYSEPAAIIAAFDAAMVALSD